MKAKAAVVGGFVRRIAPAVIGPVYFGGARQRDGEPFTSREFSDRRMRPPERIPGDWTTALIAPPYRTRPVYRDGCGRGEEWRGWATRCFAGAGSTGSNAPIPDLLGPERGLPTNGPGFLAGR